MRLSKLFISIGQWLDRRFPEQMTTESVLETFRLFNERLERLESSKELLTIKNDTKRELEMFRQEMTKLKIMVGVHSLVNDNGLDS